MLKETLEEVAEKLWMDSTSNITSKKSFIAGAKWQAERMYTPEEILQCIKDWDEYNWNEDSFNGKDRLSLKKWFEKFKSK